MSDFILPHTDTKPYSLLALIALSGEFPAEQIGRFGSQSYMENVVKSLKKDRLIRTYYKDSLRGYRLSHRAKKLLLAEQMDRFSFYLTGSSETNQPKSELIRRLRLHRIAESLVLMQNTGIKIFRDEKPDIFCLEMLQQHKQIQINRPVFYTSREMRECGLEFMKIRGARMTGVLLTEEKIFIVYNTGSSMMKWEYKSEMRAKALIKTLLCRNRLSEQYDSAIVHALLIGNDMETAYQILSEPKGGTRNYFILDGNYERFHYIPNNTAGETVLRLLCNTQKELLLREILSESLSPGQQGYAIENDAFDLHGNPVLFAYDFNLPRILRFENALQLQDRNGSIICFDFQADVLRRLCGSHVQFQTINLQKYERRFQH